MGNLTSILAEPLRRVLQARIELASEERESIIARAYAEYGWSTRQAYEEYDLAIDRAYEEYARAVSTTLEETEQVETGA